MYVGEDNSTYYAAEAGLCYEIVSENKVLAYSGEHTRSRLDPCYRSGAMEKISPQLGYSYRYDSRREDGWTERHADGFGRSVCIEKNCRLVVRPIERLRYVWEAPHILRSCGGYSLPENKGTAAEKVKNSYLRHAAPCNEVKLPSENGFTVCSDATGCYILVDMLEECAGFAYLDFELPQDAEVYIAFGEHLHDLRVRAEIGGRNFAATNVYRASGQKPLAGLYAQARLAVFADPFFCSAGQNIRLQDRKNGISGRSAAGEGKGSLASANI